MRGLALLLGLGAAAGGLAGSVGLATVALLWTMTAADGAPPDPALLVVLPVAGGLLCGLVQLAAPEVRGTGVPATRHAAAARRPVRARVALAHPIAALLCVGSGWSSGREGPALHAGGAIGNGVARLAGLDGHDRARVLAAGAAGGVAGAMNTPVAALLLASVLLLRSRADVRSMAVTAVGAAAGAALHRLLWDAGPLVPVPAPEPAQVATVVAVGLAAALAGPACAAAVHRGCQLVDRLWRGPEMLRPMTGGLLLALLLAAAPEAAGTGERLLDGPALATAGALLLAALVAAKIVATGVSAAFGGSGGTIGPVIFLGAIVGELVARVAGLLDPGLAAQSGVYRIVGMAAVFAAASGLPLAATAAAVELTGRWEVALPAVAAALLACLVAGTLTRTTLFRPGPGPATPPAGPEPLGRTR